MRLSGKAPFDALEPWDEHNQRLAANVHPQNWVNPTPKRRYHLVVVGGGTAGLVTAAIAVALGARVALIEERLMGGDCLNVGCVPSKAIIRSARVRSASGQAEEGARAITSPLEFAAAMARMRRLRSEISAHDSAARFTELGVDVYFGRAAFVGDGVIEVAGAKLKYSKAVIATGTRASIPDVPGLPKSEVLTNETVFSLTELPARLAVMGGGAIGCELAQAFAQLGSRVTILESGPRILSKDDADAAAVVHTALEASGIEILVNMEVTKAERDGDWTIPYRSPAGSGTLAADELLVAAGRAANVEGLGLEKVGVEFDTQRGIHVDDTLRTANPGIYAIGDVASGARFTHVADAHARMVVRNALFFGRGKVSSLAIPWCTYTSPELAHVGITSEEAARRAAEIETVTVPFSTVDRAKLDSQEEGFLRVHLKKGSDTIFGATLVGEHAGEIITQITQAMTAGVGLGKLGEAIYPYPTRAEIVRKAADAWRRQKLTPAAKRGFQLFFRLRR